MLRMLVRIVLYLVVIGAAIAGALWYRGRLAAVSSTTGLEGDLQKVEAIATRRQAAHVAEVQANPLGYKPWASAERGPWPDLQTRAGAPEALRRAQKRG